MSEQEIDIELLSMAAKAIGVELVWHPDEEGINAVSWDNPYAKLPHPHVGEYHWNPLISAEDALLLAVAMRMQIEHIQNRDGWFCAITFYHGEQWVSVEVEHDADATSATCRAIVRAAAEIGRAMP